MSVSVAALYYFARFDDPESLATPLRALCKTHGIMGTLLLAEEGMNGTVAGPRAGLEALVTHLRALPGCAGLEVKWSTAQVMPFLRMKVRLKREIVTMGQEGVDPLASVGAYVEPGDWNAVVDDPDVVVIDTRNDYEVELGTFEGALDPQTQSFREFPGWWDDQADALAGKTVAMFCTGGIRCEKATNYLLGKGVQDVRHLKGGILRYLEEVPAEESRWQGSCFVFDSRVSVEHGLREGVHVLCHACRQPLEPADLERDTYERGVSCHRCHDTRSEADRDRYRERQRQIDLARARGTSHLG